MLQAYNELIDIINTVRRRVRIIILGDSFLRTVIQLSCFLMLAGLTDYIFGFNSAVRTGILVFLIIAGILLCIINVIVPLFRKISDDVFALYIQEKYPYMRDDIINAIQLFRLEENEKRYISEELIHALVKDSALKAQGIDPNKLGETSSLKRNFTLSLLCTAVFLMLYLLPPGILSFSVPRILYPHDYSRVSELLKVVPGDCEILKAKDLSVQVKTAEDVVPYIKFKVKGGKWTIQDMARTGDRVFSYVFTSVIEPIDYLLQWKDYKTPLYHISVIEPPVVGDITLKYIYPSYTSMKQNIQYHSNGDILAPEGTNVTISARTNKPLREAHIITREGRSIPLAVKDDIFLEGSINITMSGEYWIELMDLKGYTNANPIRHSITMTEDDKPTITLLSPAQNLTVSEKAVINLLYEVRDDFGVKEVYIVYKNIFKTEDTYLPVKTFTHPVKGKVLEYEWTLRDMAFMPGDSISYYLEVRDNDTVSGTNRGFSDIYNLEIFSYEKEHQLLAALGEHVYEEIKRILQEQISTRDELSQTRDLFVVNEAEAFKDMEILFYKQNNISDDTQDLVDVLGKMVERMKNDPLTHFETYTEYMSLKDNLDYLREHPMQDANEGFESFKQYPSTGQRDEHIDKIEDSQEEIIFELEKMAKVSEKLMQKQKMEDVLHKGHELLDYQAEFSRLLEQYRDFEDTEKLREMEKALSRLSEAFEEINRMMAELAGNLPDEFMKGDTVIEIDFNKMQNLMKELRDALKADDIDKALQHAMDMMNSFSKMLGALQMASSSIWSQQFQNLANEADELAEELGEMIVQEKALIEKTSQLDRVRMQAMFKEQEKLLAKLAQKQKKLIEKTEVLSHNDLSFSVQLRRSFTSQLNGAVPEMKEVYQELSNLTVFNSVKILPKCIQKLQFSKEILARHKPGSDKEYSSITISISTVNTIIQGEKEILEVLEGGIQETEDAFDDEQQKQLNRLSSSQDDIKTKAEQFMRKLDSLSSKTSLIGHDIFRNMQDGRDAMGAASADLSNWRTGSALNNERDALYYLSQSQQGIQSAAGALASMQQNMGMPMAGSIQPMPGGRIPGRFGAHTGFIEIPSPEDYQGPRILYEEILKGIKENYPEIYEGLIKEYYKQLTE